MSRSGRLRLHRVESIECDHSWPDPYDDPDVQSTAELLAEYGLAADLPIEQLWPGHSYVRMAQHCGRHLLRDMSAPKIIAVAYATPDLMLTDVVGCHLADALGCDERPDVYGVSDQGGGAGLTALQIADGLVRLDGTPAAGLLFAADQVSPYHVPGAPHPPRVDCAAVIRFSTAEGPAFGDFRVLSSADPAATLNSALRDDQRIVGVYVSAALLGASGDAGRIAPGHDLFVGPNGTCTSLWRALESKWPDSGTHLLADYDPFSQRVYLATLDADDQGIGEEA